MNTKHILRYAAAAVAAIAALACSKDDAANPEIPGTPENPDTATPFTISASIDDGADTRISMDDDGTTKIELKWKPGDQIYVMPSATSDYSENMLMTFTVSDASISADGKNAEFQAPSGYPTDAIPTYALHQGTERMDYSFFDPTSVTPNPILETLLTLSTLPDNYLLYATYDAETKRLAFKPLSAVLKLKVTLPAGVSGTLSRIRIGAADGSEIFYAGDYDITSGTAIRGYSMMNNSIQFSGSLQIVENTETELYLALEPGTELNGQPLEIDLIVGNTVCAASIKGGKLEAGKCYPLTLGTAKWTFVGNIYDGGTGAQNDPYQIKTETNLRALARAVRAGIDYSETSFKYFRLMNDIPVHSSEADPWLPIGISNNSFTGKFDGNEKTVSGTLHLSDKDGIHLGLFGAIPYNGSISGLTLDGEVSYKSSENINTMIIGGIVGFSGSEITGCSHTGSLTVENTVPNGQVYVGGIVGKLSKSISDCTQKGGTITVNMPNAPINVGGIVGYFYGSSTKMHTCRNESNIAVTGRTSYVGALVGFSSATIYNCSTFPDPGLTVTVNGTTQNPVKAVGNGNALETCTEHPVQ